MSSASFPAPPGVLLWKTKWERGMWGPREHPELFDADVVKKDLELLLQLAQACSQAA